MATCRFETKNNKRLERTVKKCYWCKIEKPSTGFYENKKTSSGLQGRCKDCYGFYTKNWIKENYEKHRKYQREYQREWREVNRNKMRKYNLDYYRNNLAFDIKHRINDTIGSGIWRALKETKRGRKWEKILGYNLNDLMKHLESKFEPWMSWENYGEWHIDHIIPKSLFKYEKESDSGFKECWSLKNLQPLSKELNYRKHNNPFFEKEL